MAMVVARAGRVRETASMAAEYAQSDQFRGARIHLCDLAGLEIRDCEVSGLKIVDCYGGDVYLGGAFERVVVNDVDVTAYVEAELDRRHPTRVLARDAASPDDYRAAWEAMETLWAATLDRARLLPEAKLHERVNGEWSFVETQRHLLMAGDAWLGNAVLEEEAPYHLLGFPHGGMPPEATAKLGLTPDATPTLDEVLAPRLARMATMRRVVDGLSEAELDRVCGRRP
ncbi:DinB family protein, partial [Nonomuraea sp. NPDC055795]